MFFEDLELPDLVKKSLKDTTAFDLQRAGYTVTGTPSNLSDPAHDAATAWRGASRCKRPKLSDLEALREAGRGGAGTSGDEEEADGSRPRSSSGSERRSKIIPYIDPIDVRYRRFDRVPRPNTEAVMFCLMDVSGSMTEAMKDLAKRFFMLLARVSDRGATAMSMSSSSAIPAPPRRSTRRRSSTAARPAARSSRPRLKRCWRSPAPAIRPTAGTSTARRPRTATITAPTAAAASSLLGGEVLPLCQYFAYVEVGDGMGGSLTGLSRDSDLWRAYSEVAPAHPHFAMRRVGDPAQIFSVFHELFAKGGVRA